MFNFFNAIQFEGSVFVLLASTKPIFASSSSVEFRISYLSFARKGPSSIGFSESFTNKELDLNHSS